MTQPHPDVMVSEGPPRHAIVPDSTILTPDTTHALGPSPGASSSTASTPGQRATRSDWQIGNALFDLQTKPFHAPDHGITVSSSPGPPQEDKVPAASLNPYRDGRIRTAVPSKLKGRMNMKQGNFSVMHMHIQKPQITERDLAAKLTSERTAAAAAAATAKLASAQGYRYPRRPRPPHTAAARNLPQYLSNPPSVTADIHGPLSQPPPPEIVVPYEERRVETGSAQASARLEENPLTEPDSMENIETKILAESTKGDVTPGVDHEQEDAPFLDANSVQDVSMNPSNEIAAPVDSIQNREQPAIAKLLTTILPPEEVRAEQHRLLELLRKLHPSTVVETLCSALTQFGGATRQPPSPHGESSESGSKKSSGDLFISWISEIFPPNFAENSTTKRSSKPSTGRPRGRPKGSTKRIVDADLRPKRTAFVPLAMRPSETDRTQRSTLAKCSNAPPESVANNPRLYMPLPCASNNQMSSKLLPRVTKGRISITAAPSITPRLINVSGEDQRTTSGPSMTPAESTGESTPIRPYSSVTTSTRTKSTGRTRGRPKGSRNKPRLLPAKPASSSFNPTDSHLRESRPRSHEPTTRESMYNSLISTPDSSYVTETGSALRTTFSLPELPYPTEEAASIMQGDATGSPGCTQENKTPTAAGSSVIIQGPQGPPSHPQDADLSGPMYYNGIYHQFYQYNPNGSVWGNIVWAHSVSTDLINWIQLEPAIERTTPSDINGCWTGSATILKSDQPAIIYTGADTEKRQVQNIAFPKNLSDPYLREWIKPDNNPLIQPVGQGLIPNQFRDPTTGWIGPDGLWRIAVGAELDGYSAALLYKSEDFLHWTRVDHPLYSSNASTMWECPDFFAVLPGKNIGLDLSAAIPNGAKHVLKMSLDNCDKYMIGIYDLKSDVFVPDSVLEDRRLWSRIDYGNYYASKSFFDSKKGRRIIWGWTNETDSSSYDVAKGWAGIHAIPRTIWLDKDSKQLLQWPVEEIESLRGKEVSQQGLELKKGDLFEIKEIDTLQADVEIDFELTSIDSADAFDPSWLLDIEKHCREADASVHGGVGPFGLVLLASDNMEEHTSVHFRVYKSQEKYMVLMCSDLRKSSLRPELYTPAYGGFFEFDLEKEKTISLRTLIDRSAVESFGGGGRVCIMARVYPVALIDDGGTRMYAFNNGTTTVKVPRLKAWSMRRAQVNVKKG